MASSFSVGMLHRCVSPGFILFFHFTVSGEKQTLGINYKEAGRLSARVKEQGKCQPVSRRSPALVLARLALALSSPWGSSSLVNSMILLWLILTWTSLKRLAQTHSTSLSEYSAPWPIRPWKCFFPCSPLNWSSSSTRLAPDRRQGVKRAEKSEQSQRRFYKANRRAEVPFSPQKCLTQKVHIPGRSPWCRKAYS